MKTSIKSIVSIALVAFVLPSCVMKKKYTALEASKQEVIASKEELQGKYKKLQAKSTDLEKELKELNTQHKALLADYKRMGDLKAENETLSQKEKMKIENDLKKKMAELEASNKRVKDLENAMNAQKAEMDKIKNQIQNALKVLNNENLTVEHRGNKVYVSLPEDLLFKSGSATVESGGKDALQKFAEVMQNHQDIEIAVEGHTDSIRTNGVKFKDNWDLSVLRATSVIRILTDDYALNPKMITASGKGQHQPIGDNKTKEGRARNRRIEIVLIPKIDALFEYIK